MFLSVDLPFHWYEVVWQHFFIIHRTWEFHYVFVCWFLTFNPWIIVTVFFHLTFWFCFSLFPNPTLLFLVISSLHLFIDSLAAIARKRPLHYNAILNVLLDFNPNLEMVKGCHASSVLCSVRTAFLGFLRSTNPTIMEVYMVLMVQL